VVLLHTDKKVVKQRLVDRYDQSSEAEKVIRQSLNELNDDFIDKINNRYEALEKKGVFSLKFDTSKGSIEEVTENLMKELSVKNKH
jgi:hypothetical protein